MESKPICRITHRQLLQGACPWCADFVAGSLQQSPSNSEQLIWNTEVIDADLSDPDVEVRMLTTSNLLSHGPPLVSAIPLLAKALNDSDVRVRDHAGYALSRLGSDLPEFQTADLEASVNATEHQLAVRTILVGYYCSGRKAEVKRFARREHILWLIEHAPESKVCGQPDCSLLRSHDSDGYQQGKELWLANVDANPDNPAILANAASFFLLNDQEICERLLNHGNSLQPGEPRWLRELGQLYSLASLGKGEQQFAAKSFAAYAEADRITPTDSEQDSDHVSRVLSRIHTLPDLAKSALEACEFEHASNYAAELLSLARSDELPEFFRDDGNAVHFGNTVLGCVALERGDVEAAKLRLLAAGKSKGSPSLMSFGPNMRLAKRLLELGEKEVVLVYFQLCAEFWARGAEQLQAWRKQVDAGEIPDFGANLVY